MTSEKRMNPSCEEIWENILDGKNACKSQWRKRGWGMAEVYWSREKMSKWTFKRMNEFDNTFSTSDLWIIHSSKVRKSLGLFLRMGNSWRPKVSIQAKSTLTSLRFPSNLSLCRTWFVLFFSGLGRSPSKTTCDWFL